MSNQNNNNSIHPLSLANNDAYAWYYNGNRVILDLISSPSSQFPPSLNERVRDDPWMWSLEDRILAIPSSMRSFPRPRMHIMVLQNNLANNINSRSRRIEELPTHDLNYRTKALEKLTKQIYNPIPKKIIQRLGRFYRQKDGNGEKEVDDNDDNKRCAICLEDLEATQVVMVTPCNHTFHEACIFPWVKIHMRCPVCRFSLCERIRESGASSS